MSQTEHLKSMLSGFTRNIEVLQKLNKMASNKVEGQDLTKVNKMTSELTQAIKKATGGDSDALNKFVSSHADINK